MLTWRKPSAEDACVYFDWANDEQVRQQSFQSKPIAWEDHIGWFMKKLEDPACQMLFFEDDEMPVGQVRFQDEDEQRAVIGISIAGNCRGRGYAIPMLKMACEHFFSLKPGHTVLAYIKEENTGSVRSFAGAGFNFSKKLLVADIPSVLYIKQSDT